MSGLPGLRGIDHVAMTVPDLPAAVAFYRDVIGATECHELGPFDSQELPPSQNGLDWSHAHLDVPDARLTLHALRLGSIMLELVGYDRPESGTPAPPRNSDLGGGHIAIAVDDVQKAVEHLREHGARVLDGPIEVGPDAPSGAMLCWYVQDPWGNQLEIVEYPSH